MGRAGGLLVASQPAHRRHPREGAHRLEADPDEDQQAGHADVAAGTIQMSTPSRMSSAPEVERDRARSIGMRAASSAATRARRDTPTRRTAASALRRRRRIGRRDAVPPGPDADGGGADDRRPRPGAGSPPGTAGRAARVGRGGGSRRRRRRRGRSAAAGWAAARQWLQREPGRGSTVRSAPSGTGVGTGVGVGAGSGVGVTGGPATTTWAARRAWPVRCSPAADARGRARSAPAAQGVAANVKRDRLHSSSRPPPLPACARTTVVPLRVATQSSPFDGDRGR